jgi:DNA repair exonuclease SbcCD nuclease subunit
MTTRLLVVGDIHIARTPPGRRTDSYMSDVLRKLDRTVEIAKEQGVDGVLWLGDVFHNHRADRVPHEVVKAISVRLRAYGLPVFVVVGNHDIYAYDLEGSYTTQPIAMLEELENVTLLRWDPVQIGDVQIHPVPGVAHLPIEEYTKRLTPGDPELFQLAAIHQSIARDGKDSLPFSHVGAEEVAAALPWLDLAAYGHLHESYGWYTVDGLDFVNFGSVSRGSISEGDVKKTPQVFVLTVDGKQAEYELFELPYRPADEVFKLEEYITEKARKADMVEYVAHIERVSVTTFSLDTIIGSIHQRDDVTDPVKDYAVDCIAQVRAS